MYLSLAQIQNLNRQVGWPENQIVKSSAIAIYESSGNPNAINNGSATHTNEYSVGLYQINTLAHHGYTVQQLQDAFTNSSIALTLWRARPNYGDWYNSNNKYNANRDGIASQAQAIYNSGNIDSNNVNTNISDVLANPNNNTQDDTALYVVLGLVALYLFI